MSARSGITLAENVAATGSWVNFPGGAAWFMVEATFGGGTVKIQTKNANGTAVDVASGSVTAAGYTQHAYLPAGEYRCNIATATAVYAKLIPCPTY